MGQMEPAFIVSGCGEARFDAIYYQDPGATQRAGYSSPYRQEGGTGTIEFHSAGQWQLTESYGGRTYYGCYTKAPLPPTTGWTVFHSTKPAPTLEATTRLSQAREPSSRARFVMRASQCCQLVVPDVPLLPMLQEVARK